MACVINTQQLQQISGMISENIYRETLTSNIWLNRVTQKTWPDGMGDTISTEIQDITLPVGGLQWIQASQATDSTVGTSCGLTGQDVAFGSTLRQSSLYKAALNSPSFCVDKIRFAWQFKKQMDNIYSLLKEASAYVITDRYRKEYSRLAGHHVISGANFKTTYTGTGAAFPNTAPTSKLTRGQLRWAYQRILRAGGGMFAAGKENGRPVFLLITDGETSEDLIKTSDAIRQDYRYSSKVDELLAPLGIERSYGGFYHVCDDLPRRFDNVGGVWIEHEPFVNTATSTGSRRELNPYYENALYTESYIFTDIVMESLIPTPISSAGGQSKFNPVQYRGEFAFRQPGIDKTCNPDGDTGWFRAVYQLGTTPIKPQFGYAFRHLRCIENDLAGCTVSYS